MKRLIPPAAAAALLAVAFASTPAGAQQTTPFKNCTAAYQAGRANIPASDPAYGKHLDDDGDGFGCDKPPPGFVPKAPVAVPTTAAPRAVAPTTVPTVRPPVKATPKYTG